MSARNCIISASFARSAGALFTVLKEKETKAERMRIRNGRKGRKEGSLEPGLEGIVSVMLIMLQLAEGVSHAQKSSLWVNDWLGLTGGKT